MASISPEAKQIYLHIQASLTKNGQSPTIQEIVDAMKLSTRKVVNALRELEDALIIKRSQYRSRSIELIADIDDEGKAKESSFPVPILGTAPGGHFLTAEQNIEDYINVPSRLLKGRRDVFILRVVGDSMSPFLDDGDLAIIKKQESANARDIVVAVREGITSDYEATIKEYLPHGDHIILNPINRKKYEPIIGNPQTIKVQGIVIGAIKMFEGN